MNKTQWPAPGVRLRSCVRCGEGATETDPVGDVSCLTCGFVKYYQKPNPDVSQIESRASREQRKPHINKGKSETIVEETGL